MFQVILGEEILEEGSKVSCKNDGFADLPPFSNSFNKQFNLKYKILEVSSKPSSSFGEAVFNGHLEPMS